MNDGAERSIEEQKAVLRAMLERPIAFSPIFARITGSVTAGLFLSQIYYWCDKGADPDGWIYKTIEQVEAETTLSRHEQDSVRRLLRATGLCEIAVKGCPPRIHYRVNLDAIQDLVALEISRNDGASNLPKIGRLNLRKPATQFAENRQILHTETTTEITNNDRFDEFYKLYPRKTGKAAAIKAWSRIKPDEALTAKIMGRLRTFIAVDWKETAPQFVPHPATWLNGKRWEDEVVRPAAVISPRGEKPAPPEIPLFRRPTLAEQKAKEAEQHAAWQREHGL